MYLPSKIKLKYYSLFFLAIFLIFLSFKAPLQNLMVFLCRQLTMLPQRGSTEIEEIRKNNLELNLQIRKLQHLEDENNNLRMALKIKEDKKIELIASETITFSPSSWRRFIIINSGKDIGLTKGLLVIDENANLVGIISEVKDNSSFVLLVNDPNFSSSVFIGEKGLGLLKGNLINAEVLYVDDKDEISVGDKVWLKISSLSSIIIIGEITSAKKNANSLFWDVNVKLLSQNTHFDRLFIVK